MKYITTLLTVFLFGCSFTPKKLTPEKRAEALVKAEQVREQLVKPIYWLARESCVYHVKNGRWPQVTNNTVEGELIEYISRNEVLDNSFNLNLKLKTLPSEIIIQIDKKSATDPVYSFQILSSRPNKSFNFAHPFDCVGPSLDEDKLLLLSAMYAPILDLSSHKKTIMTPPFFADISEIALKTSLCILLKLEPYQCG